MSSPEQHEPELVTLSGSEIPAVATATKLAKADAPAAPADAGKPVQVTVVIRPDPARADLRLRQDPTAHATPGLAPAPMSRDEVRAAFTSSPAEMEQVASVLQKEFNLRVVLRDPETNRLKLEGAVDDVEKAFGVELDYYKTDSGVYRGFSGSVSIAKDIAGLVVAVLGLDTFPIARTPSGFDLIFQQLPGDPTAAAAPSGVKKKKYPRAMYTATQVAEMYNFPGGASGKNQTVAIVAPFGGGFHREDVAQYFSRIGLPIPNIIEIGANDPTPSAQLRKLLSEYSEAPCDAPPIGPSTIDKVKASWTLEITMDVELLGTFANQAQILVYFGNGDDSQSVYDTLAAVLNSRQYAPQVLSLSWGEQEELISPVTLVALEQIFQKFALSGVTVCASSGDSGSTPPLIITAPVGVVYPASSAWVLSVGGTTLIGAGSTIHREIAWNSYTGATGGGVSKIFARDSPSSPAQVPWWQATANVPVKTGGRVGRGMPDVSAVADAVTGCLLVVGGCEFVSNGTSASAPLWAGLLACVNEALNQNPGWYPPLLYQPQVQSALNDIIDGTNSVKPGVSEYVAGPEWDPCTGLGTPDGQRLVEALRGVTPAASATPTPAATPAASADQPQPDTSSASMSSRPQPSAVGAEKYVYVDLGFQKSDLIRRLRSGKGKLAHDLDDTIEELESDGNIDEGTRVIAVVVQRDL